MHGTGLFNGLADVALIAHTYADHYDWDWDEIDDSMVPHYWVRVEDSPECKECGQDYFTSVPNAEDLANGWSGHDYEHRRLAAGLVNPENPYALKHSHDRIDHYSAAFPEGFE